MAEMMTTDVRAIMDRSPFDVAAVADLRELLNRDPSRYRTLRESVLNIKEREKKDKEGKPETHLRLGVGEVLLGRFQSGLEYLKKAGELGMACYFRGIAQVNQQQYEQAAASFASAAKHGYDPRNSELHRAGALRRARKGRRGQENPGRAGQAERGVGGIPLPARLPALGRRRDDRGFRRIREDASARQRP